MLFQPLHGLQRTGAQTLAEGIVSPMAAGLAGLLLLTIERLWPAGLFAMAGVMGAVALTWLVVALLLRREYPRALAHGLRRRLLGGEVFTGRNLIALEVLHRTAMGQDPIGVLHALELLAQTDPGFLIVQAGALLRHPAPEVRLAVLRGLGHAAIPQVLVRLEEIARADPVPDVRAAAILLLAAQSPFERWVLIERQLRSPLAPVRQAALAALLRYGDSDRKDRAAELLTALAMSSLPEERVMAADVLADCPDPGGPGLLAALCRDLDPRVRRVAFASAGARPVPQLLPVVVEALADSSCRGSAVTALLTAGSAGVEALLAALEAGGQSLEQERRLMRLLGRVPEPAVIAALSQRMESREPSLRQTALLALCTCGFEPDEEQRAVINARLIEEVRLGAWILRAQGELIGALHPLLSDAFDTELDRCRERLLLQLELLYSRESIRQARLRYWGGSRRERALALELLDTTISPTHHDLVFPLMERLAAPLALVSLPGKHVPPLLGAVGRIRQILMASEQEFPVPPWIRCCTSYALTQRPQPIRSGVGSWPAAVAGSVRTAKISVHIEPDPEDLLAGLTDTPSPVTSAATMEKVLLLKSVGIFSSTPADVLRQLADALEEVSLSSGESLFTKGDLGTSMYVVVDGLVRVHIGDQTVVELGPRQIVGELAALDPEPRSASVSAIEPTRLYRIEQEMLLDLMADQPEIVQGVIRELAHRLRDTTAPYGLDT
jgi:HEAT repeat protein